MIGLQDKLYWRMSRHTGKWHCFKRYDLRRRTVWRALCCPEITIMRLEGQDIRRPIPLLRCAACDGAEMKRRGWEESGPETVHPDGSPVIRPDYPGRT